MKIRLIFYLAFAVMLAVSGCEEDEPSQIPTVPTTFSLEDGAEITDTIITLKVSGSTVEDEVLKVSYVYYIGTKANELEETPAEVTLEPYTQYFWCAQAKTEVGEGEKTEVRTFYCVPGFDVTTDNGYGEYAAVIKWNNGDKFKSVAVSATANHDGYELEPQTITDGADSCYFVRKRDASDPTKDNAFVQWWDDEHGIYAEPVVYDFTVEAKVQVGDKTFTLTNRANECILDKQQVVRDHEFNVYRVVKIGNQTWLADDLMATSFYYDNKLVKLSDCSIHNFNGDPHKMYEQVTLKSGSVGLLYCIGELYYSEVDFSSHSVEVYKLLPLLVPKGFHIPTNEDWDELENYYGIQNPQIVTDEAVGISFSMLWHDGIKKEDSYYYDYINRNNICQGSDVEIRKKMSSKYDWEFSDEQETPNETPTFNAKPFIGNGYGCAFYTDNQDYSIGLVRVLTVMDNGIANFGMNFFFQGYAKYASIRCVKDK